MAERNERAKRADGPDESSINLLFRSRDALSKVERKRKKARGDSVKYDRHFNLGDTVITKAGEGITKIPNGPGGTVGVSIDGELQMFDRKDVRRVDENEVVAHIMRLAGVPNVSQEVAPVTQDDGHTIQVEPVNVNGVESCDEVASSVHCALDQIESLLPKVTVKDLKGIRERIHALSRMLYEGRQARSLRSYMSEATPVGTIPPVGTSGTNKPGTVTLGRNRAEAVKALKLRMGNNADDRTANHVFDDMQRDGDIKRQNGAFTMPEQDDEAMAARMTLAKHRR